MRPVVDSHCHLDLPELVDDLPGVLERMEACNVVHALCVSISLEAFPEMLRMVERYAKLSASVGVHPDQQNVREPSVEELTRLATHSKVVAIGETGLDYYRVEGDLDWQRNRFRTHIRAAREIGKPLIVHCRAAADDLLRIMREEHAAEVGGVMHCFTETWEVAEQAMELNFAISLSGIVTFKNAGNVRAVAQRVPSERLLVETDSPYLAPVPFRGKRNEPAYVRYVAEEIARLRGATADEISRSTCANFFEMFGAL
jgi:TatD DNase family protein